jgi:hypothetical protein
MAFFFASELRRNPAHPHVEAPEARRPVFNSPRGYQIADSKTDFFSLNIIIISFILSIIPCSIFPPASYFFSKTFDARGRKKQNIDLACICTEPNALEPLSHKLIPLIIQAFNRLVPITSFIKPC